MSFKIGGGFTLTINGVLKFTGPEATYAISGANQERINTSSGRLAYTSRRQPGFIEVELLIRRSEDLRALDEIDGATVDLVLANGRTIRGTSMTRIGEPLVFSASEGTTTLRVEGDVTDAG